MKHSLLLIAILCVTVLLVSCGTPATQTGNGDVSSSSSSTTTTTTTAKPSNTRLTKNEAKAVALKHAGVKEADIFDLDIELDRKGKTAVYDISFETKSFEFDYDIDAQNGKVLHSKKEPQSSTVKPTKSSTSATTATTTKPTGGWLTKKEAKAVACKHAGVKEAEIFDLDIELDRESGVPVYEIDFETAEYEYEYHILAENGKIDKVVRKKQDDKVSRPTSTTATTTSAATISKERAKTTALKHAGVKEADTFDLEIELDREEKTTVYEISFETKQFDFDYTIHAKTGAVLRFEKEPHS